MLYSIKKKNRILNEKERKIVAYHEMGHALIAASLPGTDPVHKVSIVPRGIGALGYTIQRPTEDRFLMTREELENKMAVLLGGRAAEKIRFDHLSTGAVDDLGKATDIAREMVTKYGMDEELGSVAYEQSKPTFLNAPGYSSPKSYSEESAKLIDQVVKELVETALQRALKTLEQNRAVLEDSAQSLLSNETLTAEELQTFFDRIATH